MIELRGMKHGFRPGITGPETVLGEGSQVMHGNVAVLVDGTAQHGPAMLAEKGREIRPPSEKADPKRCPRNDHLELPRTAWAMLLAMA
jgi:hypothetical protein